MNRPVRFQNFLYDFPEDSVLFYKKVLYLFVEPLKTFNFNKDSERKEGFIPFTDIFYD